jgi:Holliday junction resolvase RusA-like endonuclease
MISAAEFNAAVAQLEKLGYSRSFAAAEVERQLGLPERRDTDRALAGGATMAAAALNPVPLPFSIVLPWSHLVSDNDRATPINGEGGKPAKMILAERYKTARLNIVARVRSKLGGAHDVPAIYTPRNEPLRLEARVWVPDNRVHDVHDFAKGVHDALARQLYTNDHWLHDTRWIRAGVDVDHPRAEITITPL